MKPLMDRITDALQRQRDMIAELRELSDEFSNGVSRFEVISEDLQARLDRKDTSKGKVVALPKVEPDEDFRVPNALKDGPIKRGD